MNPHYRSEDGVMCLECGRWFQALPTHVIRAHGYASAQEYREQHGLSRRGLVSEELSRRMAAHAQSMGLPELGRDHRVTGQRSSFKLSPEGRRTSNQNLVLSPEQRVIRNQLLYETHERRRSATHCRRGHAYDEANTRLVKGARVCRECSRLGQRQRRRDIGTPTA